MAHIIIAGRPNSEDTSECIILAENLQAKFPTVRFVKVLKHADEWDNYAEKLCNLYGFLKNTHPLIFYSNGSFIGVKEDFFKLVKSNFKIPLLNDDCKLLVDYTVVKALTQENIKITNEEYFTRIKGSKLRDKIEKKFDEITRTEFEALDMLNRYNSLDSVYEEEYIGDLKIFYKYNNKFQPREGEYQPHSDSLQSGIIEVEILKSVQTRMSLNVEQIPIKKDSSNEEDAEEADNLELPEDGMVTDGENLETIQDDLELENSVVSKKKPPKSKNIF
jgi:hypothetical protein